MAFETIQTPPFRAAWLNLFEPEETDSGLWRYTCTMIFPPDADLKPFGELVQRCIDNKWKGNPPKTGVIKPFRRGEWKTEQNPRGYDLDKYPYYTNNIIVTASCYTNKLPDGSGFDRSRSVGIVGPDAKIIPMERKHEVYNGCYGRAEVSCFVPKQGSARVSVGIHHFQKIKDGEPIGFSGGNPEGRFEAVEPEAFGDHDDLITGAPADDLLGV